MVHFRQKTPHINIRRQSCVPCTVSPQKQTCRLVPKPNNGIVCSQGLEGSLANGTEGRCLKLHSVHSWHNSVYVYPEVNPVRFSGANFKVRQHLGKVGEPQAQRINGTLLLSYTPSSQATLSRATLHPPWVFLASLEYVLEFGWCLLPACLPGWMVESRIWAHAKPVYSTKTKILFAPGR